MSEEINPKKSNRLRNWLLGGAGIITALVTVSEGLPRIITAWHKAAHSVGLVEEGNTDQVTLSKLSEEIKPSTNFFSAIDTCEELWLERNLIFNRNGLCFESELGKAVFDNEDCADQATELSMHEDRRSKRIHRWETLLGCYIDTDQEKLVIRDNNKELAFGIGGHVFRREE